MVPCSSVNCSEIFDGTYPQALNAGWKSDGMRNLCPNCQARAARAESLPTREQLALRVEELERQLESRDKIRCAVASVASCEKQWQSDIQKQSLERSGLADEFPYGCDAIDHVAEALVTARKQIVELSRQLADSRRDNADINAIPDGYQGVQR